MGKLSDFFDENGPAKKIWNSPKIGVPLWLAGASFTIYWLFYVPPPGYAIGALAVVAGVMSVREVKILGKVMWVFLLICLLVTEDQAIKNDRAENQDQQQKFFKAQKAGFDATASGLKTAIDGLNQTLKQTHPYAAIRFDKLEFAGTPPTEMSANTPMTFNFYYTDNGNETATNVRYLSRIYVGKPGDKGDQQRLGKLFEEDWHGGGQIVKTNSVLVPAYQSASSIHQRSLTDEEAKQLSQYATLYFFVRFEYSDSAGQWRTDACTSFQREEPAKLDYNIFQTCFVFNRFRYATKP